MRRVSVTDQEESVATPNASPAGIYIRYEPGESALGRVILLDMDDSPALENSAAARREMASGREPVINS